MLSKRTTANKKHKRIEEYPHSHKETKPKASAKVEFKTKAKAKTKTKTNTSEYPEAQQGEKAHVKESKG